MGHRAVSEDSVTTSLTPGETQVLMESEWGSGPEDVGGPRGSISVWEHPRGSISDAGAPRGSVSAAGAPTQEHR